MTTFSLPAGGTWIRPQNGLPILSGTDKAESLHAIHGEASVLVGRGGGDVLVGAKGKNIFKYENETDSPQNRPDVILNFNLKEDKIDLSELLKSKQINTLNFPAAAPRNVGDVQITQNKLRQSILAVKLNPEGPDFAVRVDRLGLNKSHVKFF